MKVHVFAVTTDDRFIGPREAYLYWDGERFANLDNIELLRRSEDDISVDRLLVVCGGWARVIPVDKSPVEVSAGDDLIALQKYVRLLP